MKKLINLKISVIFLILISNLSCSDSGETWDLIQLSQKKVEFNNEQNSIIITTKGEWWWIDEISLNNTTVNLSDIDTRNENIVIETSEFKIERKNNTKIHIEMTKNQTGSERKLIIVLNAGDYYDRIKVTQSAN